MPIPQHSESTEFTIQLDGEPISLLGCIFRDQPDRIYPTAEMLRVHPYLPKELLIDPAKVIRRGWAWGTYCLYPEPLLTI